MFDISFFELLVVGVVGLIVIGPERLPGTVRTCALWIGRIKRNLLETRRELEKQIGADEIRRELHNEQVLHNMEKMKETRLELEAKIRQLESGSFLTDSPPVAERAQNLHLTEPEDLHPTEPKEHPTGPKDLYTTEPADIHATHPTDPPPSVDPSPSPKH